MLTKNIFVHQKSGSATHQNGTTDRHQGKMIQEITARLDQLEAKVEQVEARRKVSDAKVQLLESKLRTSEAKAEEFKTHLKASEAQLALFKTYLESSEEKVQLENDLGKIKRGVKLQDKCGIKKTIEDLRANGDRMRKQMALSCSEMEHLRKKFDVICSYNKYPLTSPQQVQCKQYVYVFTICALVLRLAREGVG